MNDKIKDTLDILWALRDGDKHYFYAYGREHLELLVKDMFTADQMKQAYDDGLISDPDRDIGIDLEDYK